LYPKIRKCHRNAKLGCKDVIKVSNPSTVDFEKMLPTEMPWKHSVS
jgi:hypothetical protein